MCESKLGLAALLRDLKDNVCALPFGFVVYKSQFCIRYMPHNFLARNKLRNLLFGTVHVLDTVRELGAEFVGVALDFS